MPGSAPIRVLVADDQALVRDGLVTILSLVADMEVVGEAEDGRAAVELAVRTRPDVVLMDLRMPVLDGVAATARLRTAVPTAAVLVLTTYSDDDSIVAALRSGATGYLTKDAGRDELASAIRSVAHGQGTFAPRVLSAVVDAIAATAPDPAVSPEALAARFPDLTVREAEVLSLVAAGLGNAEIARRLYVEVSTVKTHINAVFAKLGTHDRARAIAIALGEGEGFSGGPADGSASPPEFWGQDCWIVH